MSNQLVPVAVGTEVSEWMPAMSIDQASKRYQAMKAFVTGELRDGLDFGKIPGSDKPTLLKPGAEKLATFFGLRVERPEIVEAVKDWTGADHGGEPFFYYEVLQSLTRNGHTVAACLASCSSWESKYRYRRAERVCPTCGKQAIIKGKAEYGGGWVCFKKKDGCNAKFRDGDPAIESQSVGRVANPDIFDQLNTVQKMAQKRALIGAVLIATNASEFFTQDLEDYVHHDEPAPAAAPAPPPAPPKPANGHPPKLNGVVDCLKRLNWKNEYTVSVLRSRYEADRLGTLNVSQIDDFAAYLEAQLKAKDAPPVELIGADQLDELDQAAAEGELSEDQLRQVMDRYQVKTLAELPDLHYRPALAMIRELTGTPVS